MMKHTATYIATLLHDGRRSRLLSSWGVFVAAFIIYLITADRFASFWDCPEYIVCASRLEVGHPPGNPIWMLAMRVLTIPFPPEYHAFAVSIGSALMMALAAMLLAKLCWLGAAMIIRRNPFRLSILPAIGGGLAFALCDSVWFSAVEAEVYAMSAFLSLLSLWLMVKWFAAASPGRRRQYLILIAYLMGLSLGVHQLNLLVIPVLTLIYRYRFTPGRLPLLKGLLAILAGCVIVCVILFGIMPGFIRLAGLFELTAANTFGLPLFAGAIIYAALLILLIPLAAALLSRCPAWQTAVWSLGFILLGYSSFALILIRGYAAPPMNEATPTDIFALESYISRDQYGSTPLLYGATPYSRPMFIEETEGGNPKYSRYSLKPGKSVRIPYMEEPRLSTGNYLMPDSGANTKVESRRHGYMLAGHTYRRQTTPELDMWLPRITGNSPAHLESYESWIGMDKESMTEVEISEAIDSLGKPVGKLGPDGKRRKGKGYRPTYLQNLQMFLSYQTGYMYFRYLFWNFMGRQNDLPSTGEIEHGNFITGLTPLDEAMLGPSSLMPSSAWKDNKGHNNYFSIPFLLGLAGITVLIMSGRPGRRLLCVSLLLFLMTGLAIVVYLNQTPGEPRERDYSFLISYAAFAFWISCAAAGAGRFIRKKGMMRTATVVVLSLLTPAMFLAINFDDHDRRGRGEPLRFASETIESNPRAIIFTQGDNFTFPSWYAREVHGVGADCVIIDATYLGVPGYVVNLMRQGDLPMTARPADIAYGAYAFTRIDSDADTTAIPLIDALRELYASRDGAPTLRHSRVKLPVSAEGDSITLNLGDFAGGGSLLPFKKLMMLDIIASNLESSRPRPVAFLNRLLTDLYRPLLPAMRHEAFTTVYAPGYPPGHPAPAKAAGTPRYLDPLVAEQARHQRGCLVSLAAVIAPADTDSARRLLDRVDHSYPYSLISPGSTPIRDSIFHEGPEYAELRLTLAETSHSRADLEKGSEVAEMMLREAREWKRYYAALPASRRHTVSAPTRRLISLIPRLEKTTTRADSLKKIL